MPRKKQPDIQSERQAQILEAAQRIFAQKGLSDARMEDIAIASGLGKGTVYLYYKNKDELIVGLLKSLFNQLLFQLQALLIQENLSVTERLMTYLVEMITQMEADKSILNISYEFYAVASRHSAIRQFLAEYFHEYRQTLADLFGYGVEQGEFAPMDTSQMAIMLIACLEGFMLLWFTDSQTISPKQMLPNIMTQFLNHLK